CLEIISISPSLYPFQWIIQNHNQNHNSNQNHKSSFLIHQLSISMDNLKIITLSFITWIFGTEIITEHYFISFQSFKMSSYFLIRQLSISMDNLKIITLSFITWIFGTEIITEHYFISFQSFKMSSYF